MPEVKGATRQQEPKSEQEGRRDAALIGAWRRFLDYDRVSSNQKKQYLDIRSWVIVLGLFTSTGAVLSTYIVAMLGVDSQAAEIIRIVLIILPIISVALMNYATQFASSTAWIEYRVGAEMIRSNIYLYRLKAGAYKDKDPYEGQKHLMAIVHSADMRIDEKNATLPYQQPIQGDIAERIASKTDNPNDKGINKINVQEYIDFRLRPQVNWYIQKIQSDYKDMRRSRILALVVAGTGSVLAGIGLGLEALVAVTTAMGVALTLSGETRMYGATYGIFHITSSSLQNELTEWEILPEEERKKPAAQAAFVERIERIFSNEREMWRTQAIQSQITAEQSLSRTITSDTGFSVQMDDDNIPLYAPNITSDENRTGSRMEALTITAVEDDTLETADVNGHEPVEEVETLTPG